MTIRGLLKGLWAFCSYLFVPQRGLRKDNKEMGIKELTEYFEHIRYQIVYYPSDMSTPLPVGVDSGFMLDYKGEVLFVTADHVVNTHDREVRIIDKNAFIQTNNIAKNEQGMYYVELVTLSNVVFCSHLKVDMNTGNVTELPLFDGAFVLMNDFMKNVQYRTNECSLNGAIVPVGEKKLHLDSSCICEPSNDDEYFVFGRVRFAYDQADNGQVLLRSQLISHDGLKYVREDGNYYVLKYSQHVVVDDWKGLSGSPVLNHQGGLIGIACKVSDVTNEVWVKKIQSMLPLFDAEILTSKINAKN